MEADPPPPPPAASALMEELMEEVLLRFPPADPASLVRAALVCRRWRGIVTGPRFRRRYRDLHLHRPMLGFLANSGAGTRFVPTSTFRPGPAATAERADGGLLLGGWRALDARHGRALLRRETGRDAPAHCELAVWDPATGRRTDLPRLPWAPYYYYPYSWNAAVLCASCSTACDYLDCSVSGGGHFLVVVVGTKHAEMFAHVYSSSTNTWTAPASARQHPDDNVDFAPTALAGTALYFAFQSGAAALKFDLGTRDMAVVRLPPPRFDWQRVVLAATDGGRRLGAVTAGKSMIYLWAREEPGHRGDGDWVQTRAVELETMQPAGAISAFTDVVSVVDGIGVVFVRTAAGLFTIDLKSLQVTKVSDDTAFSSIFPYISFHTPVASTGEGPSSGA